MAERKPIDVSGFRHLYPFRSRYLEINGLQYHFLDEGAGEPVVMVHGNPTWSFYFRALIKGLSPQYRAIAPDHIGCGLSDKPDSKQYDYRLRSRVDDLECLLDHLQIDHGLTLILHDWGGVIGLAYALRHPERIRRMIVMNTAAFFPPQDKKLPFRLWVIRNIRPFAALAVLGGNLFASGALYMASYKGLSKEVKTGLTAPYNCWRNRIATLKFVQDIPVNPKDPSYRMVKSVAENLNRLSTVPLLICWGEHDFVFDRSYLAEWQRRFPDAEIHTFPRAGHYVLEDEPEKILARVKDFLKRHPI